MPVTNFRDFRVVAYSRMGGGEGGGGGGGHKNKGEREMT